MNNAEPQKSEQPNESNWKDMPLFRQIVAAPVINAAPQISNRLPEENFAAELSPEVNAEPQKHPDPFEANSSPQIAAPPVVENSELRRQLNAAPNKKEEKDNAGLHSFKNVAPHKTEKVEEEGRVEKVKTGKAAKLPKSPKSVRRRKPRPQSLKKKSRSQKRVAEPIKMFASPAEKAELDSEAEKSGYSLSNYMRLHFGLPLNKSGRKKRQAPAASDSDELELKE